MSDSTDRTQPSDPSARTVRAVESPSGGDMPTVAAGPASPGAVPAPSARIGAYVPLRPLGRGAMGLVWLAREEPLGRLVALKVMLSAADGDARERFEREARACASLSHPNVVALLGYGEHEGAPYCAMEYVEGRTLSELLRREPVTERRGAALVLQAAEGLAHAHGRGVVHRDVKPANMLVAEGDHLKVADFGLARLEGQTTLTASVGAMGTPLYMAPEQFESAKRATARSDVWSLGATLYEVLTGRPPFHADSIEGLRTRVAQEDPLRPCGLSPSVSRDLETVCLKCLEKDPSRRYADARALADDLARWQRGEPVQARAVGTLGRAMRRVRRNPLPYVAAVLVVVALGGGVGLAQWKASREARAARQRAEAQAEDLLSRLPADRDGAIRGLLRADELLRSADAGARRYEVNLRLGEEAIAGGDFHLARLAFSTCKAVDAPRAREAGLDGKADQAEHAEAQRRRDRIEAALQAIRGGLGKQRGGMDLEDWVFEVSGYRDEQTVELLAQALQPLHDRAKREGREVHWTQEERDEATFAFRALGRLDLPSAVEPLASMLEVLWDYALLRECGVALCNTRRKEAYGPLLAAQARVGVESSAWKAIEDSFDRVPSGEVARDPRTPAEFLARGQVRRERGDLAGAMQDYARAIELDAGCVSAFVNRGALRYRSGDLDGALEDLTRASELDPRNAIALNDRGNVRKEKGDLDGAAEDFTRVVALDPRCVAAFSNRGMVRWRKGDWSGAIEDAQQAISLDPNCVPAYVTRAMAREGKGDFQGAIDDCSRAIGLDPKYAWAFLNRGRAAQKKGDLDAAARDYARVIELDPNLVEAFVNRSGVRRAQRDFDGAIEDATRAIALDPRNAAAFINRGNARFDKRDLGGAMEDCSRALDLAPRSVTAACLRGAVRTAKGDLDGAAEDYGRALGLDPRSMAALLGRGTVREEKGDHDGAIEDYTRAIAIDSTVAVPFCNRGLARCRKGDLDGAIADCTKAIAIDPRLALAFQLRAQARNTKGDVAGVLADLATFVALAPDDPHAREARAGMLQAHCLLARSAAKAGDRDKAFEHLREAMKLGYNDARAIEGDAALAPLHDDPRWGELLGRLRDGGAK